MDIERRPCPSPLERAVPGLTAESIDSQGLGKLGIAKAHRVPHSPLGSLKFHDRVVESRQLNPAIGGFDFRQDPRQC